jgi:hypothetical protein
MQMPNEHRYLRTLIQLRDEPGLPILWLSLPWCFAVAWSASVARALLVGGPATGVWAALSAGFVTSQFLLAGGLGMLATWAWLYVAWRHHPRVLCWGALVGFLGIWQLPASMVPIVPLFVSLCMMAAVLEQFIAARREDVRNESIERVV